MPEYKDSTVPEFLLWVLEKGVLTLKPGEYRTRTPCTQAPNIGVQEFFSTHAHLPERDNSLSQCNPQQHDAGRGSGVFWNVIFHLAIRRPLLRFSKMLFALFTWVVWGQKMSLLKMPTSSVLWNTSLKSAFRHQNVGGSPKFLFGGGPRSPCPPLLRRLTPVHVKILWIECRRTKWSKLSCPGWQRDGKDWTQTFKIRSPICSPVHHNASAS